MIDADSATLESASTVLSQTQTRQFSFAQLTAQP